MRGSRGSLLYSWPRKCLGRVHLFAGSHWRTPQTKLKARGPPKASRGDRLKPGQIWISKELPGQIETWMTAGGPLVGPGGVYTGSSGSFQKTGSPLISLMATWGYRSQHPSWRSNICINGFLIKRVTGKPPWWSIQEMKLVPRKIRWSSWMGKIFYAS